MHITLKNNSGFSWYKNDSLFIKGYFFDEQNVFYEKENALKYLHKIQNIKHFIETIKNLNGSFSIGIKIDNTTCIASDTTRVFPLFYTTQNDVFFISDDPLFLKNKFNLSNFNSLASLELNASYHTHGKKTLLENLFQVQSNEYLIIKGDKIIEQAFFFSYAIEKERKNNYNTQKKQTLIAFEATFSRLIKTLNNRTVVLPLSAGFDSRLIAVMLKKHNYKNVICYTYGSENSSEIENSRKTAQILNFKWHFIAYNSALIGNYLATEEFKTYANYAGKHSSMPNLQEFFAVKHLKEKHLIPDDAIFIPGYAGDLLGGSQFLKVIPKSLKTDQIADLIIKEKFSNYKILKKEKRHFKKDILKNLKNIDHKYQNKIPSSVFEDYDIKEKIAKFIFNSASFYSFFGYEHRFPFWDKELLNFFKEVPVEFKLVKLLFDDVLINEYFLPHQVYFEKEIESTQKIIQTQKIKEIVKLFLPTFIKQNILQKNDWINYKLITNQMLISLKENRLKFQRKSKNYNEIITQWYLYFSKNSIK